VKESSENIYFMQEKIANRGRDYSSSPFSNNRGMKIAHVASRMRLKN